MLLLTKPIKEDVLEENRIYTEPVIPRDTGKDNRSLFDSTYSKQESDDEIT